TGSIICSSSPFGNSSAWSLLPSSSCCWCSPYGHDSRSRRTGSPDAAGAAAGTAAHRIGAQGEGSLSAQAGTAAHSALSRSRAAHAQGRGAGGKRLLAVSRHPLSRVRRHLGGSVAGADFPYRVVVLLVGRSH